MFHMLSCFNLSPGESIDDFRESVEQLAAFLKGKDMLASLGPIGRRQRHPVMDTDDERDHEYFFIMSFADRDQCDRAVEHMYRHEGKGDTIHKAVYGRIADPVFICWEDT